MNGATDIHVYILPPVSDWYGWHDLTKTQPEDIYPSLAKIMDDGQLRAKIDRLLYQGRKYAEASLGYEGDIDNGPFYSMLPSAPTHTPIVGWQQRSRGLVFIASAVPLPYLEGFADDAAAAPEMVKSDFPF